MNAMSGISETLEIRFKHLMTFELPWAFCHALGDYLYYVMSVPVLKQVVDREFKKRLGEYAEIDVLENQTLSEMRGAKKTLLKIIEERKIDVSKFTPSPLMLTVSEDKHTMLDELERFEMGKISVGGFHSDYLENYLFDIAVNISKLGYVDDLKEFTVSDSEYGTYQSEINGHDIVRIFGGNTRGNFIFSETWPKRFQKVTAVGIARKHETWGAFEGLLKFWKAREEVIKNTNLDQIFINCLDDKRYPFQDSEAADIVGIAEDLKNITENSAMPESHLEYLRLNDLRIQVSTAHLELVQAASQKEELPKLDLTTMSKAIRNKKEQLRQQKIDDALDEIKAFMTEYRLDKLKRESDQQEDIGGKWWKTGSKPSYDRVARTIILEDRKCVIPPRAYNLQVICEKLFPPTRYIGESVQEYDAIRLFLKRKGKDVSPRAFYDAVEDLNGKIEATLKVVDMLKYQDSPCQVRVRKELFM